MKIDEVKVHVGDVVYRAYLHDLVMRCGSSGSNEMLAQAISDIVNLKAELLEAYAYIGKHKMNDDTSPDEGRQAQDEKLMGLLVHALDMLDYMEDRGFSSQRYLRSEIAAVINETTQGESHER